MFGAIVGDIAGSIYERHSFKFECCPIFAEGSRFDGDTVLTFAMADHFIFIGSYSPPIRERPFIMISGFKQWVLNPCSLPHCAGVSSVRLPA